MKLRIVSILCPKCGGAVDFHEEDRVIQCSHCGMNFIPVHSEGIERYYFKPQIKNPETRIETYLKGKGCKKNEYKILDTDKFYVPHWRSTGQITGWIAGLSPLKTVEYHDTTSAPDGRTVTVTRRRQEGGIPLKKLLRIEKQILKDAVKFPDIRLSVKEVTKVEYAAFLKLFDEPKMSQWGKILTPDIPPRIEKKNIENKFIKSSTMLYIDYNPFLHRLKVVGNRVFLYYFPVILYKVKINDEIVSVTLNCISGKITANKLIKPKEKPRNKIPLLLNILVLFLASLLTASLLRTGNSIAAQIGIAIAIIVVTFIWIKK